MSTPLDTILAERERIVSQHSEILKNLEQHVGALATLNSLIEKLTKPAPTIGEVIDFPPSTP